MRLNKSALLDAAQKLNGDDKNYLVRVEGNKIITSVKWEDETFFFPDSVTDEMRSFSYTVQILDNGKYQEMAQEKVSKAFAAKEYKTPVRTLLKEHGCKKKMGKGTKIFICVAIFLAILIATVGVFVFTLMNKKPISAQEFRAKSEAQGYQVSVLEDMQRFENKVGVKFETLGDFEESSLVAYDEEDKFRVVFLDYEDSRSAEEVVVACMNEMESAALRKGKPSNAIIFSEHYDRVTMDTIKEFRHLVRIDDTLILVSTKAENRAEVKAFIESLGY